MLYQLYTLTADQLAASREQPGSFQMLNDALVMDAERKVYEAWCEQLYGPQGVVRLWTERAKQYDQMDWALSGAV